MVSTNTFSNYKYICAYISNKALAQKLFIRHCDRYTNGVLLEINSHSLFSKWFSESGKLVMKLFEHITDIASDADTLVIVLIDEVESIAGARSSSMKSNEPGDAVRCSTHKLLCMHNFQSTDTNGKTRYFAQVY